MKPDELKMSMCLNKEDYYRQLKELTEQEERENCEECKGSGFGALSDASCSTCYDRHFEKFFSRRL